MLLFIFPLNAILIAGVVKTEPAYISAASRDNDVLESIPTFDPPARKTETVIDLLLKLDCFMSPGIPRNQFKNLFAYCRCGFMTTHRAFKHHKCVLAHPVIDLTVIPDDNASQ